MGPRSPSDRRVLFLICRAVLVWSLVNLGGSRIDGVAVFCNNSIIVRRWRCPWFALSPLRRGVEVPPIPGDDVAC